ncbi:hypothetical protein [Kitasatospora sp. NPDC087314]|uniref:hypothetical protein n=1 Tax=Kitasatospora sp. NPDC087314 TaxID=3364068 RepID=UPI003809BA32
MRTSLSSGENIATVVLHSVKHIQDRLAYAYHDGEWWRLNLWNPALDRRIPQRDHEPSGRHVANFAHLSTDWLREAVKWWLSVQLLTEQYVWSSVKSRLDGQLRTWIRGFVDHLNNHSTLAGVNKGGKLAKNSRRSPFPEPLEYQPPRAGSCQARVFTPKWSYSQP